MSDFLHTQSVNRFIPATDSRSLNQLQKSHSWPQISQSVAVNYNFLRSPLSAHSPFCWPHVSKNRMKYFTRWRINRFVALCTQMKGT